LFDDHVARDQPAHRDDGVEYAEKRHGPPLVGLEQQGREAARQLWALSFARGKPLALPG